MVLSEKNRTFLEAGAAKGYPTENTHKESRGSLLPVQGIPLLKSRKDFGVGVGEIDD